MPNDPFHGVHFPHVPSKSATALSSSTQSKPVKLRLACDSCSTAKVRCDKSHPVCGRCADNKQPCKYSASRRHGKRAHDNGQAPSSASPSGVVTPALTAFSAVSDCHSMPSFSELTWDSNVPVTSTIQPSTPRNTLESLDNWTYDDFDMTFNLNDDHEMSTSDLWLAPASPTGLNEVEKNGLDVGEDEVTSADPQIFSGKPSCTARVQQPGLTTQAADCEAQGLSVLGFLHHNRDDTSPSQGDVKAIPLSDVFSDVASTEPQPALPTVDTVLSVNKAALNKLAQLLQCSCARNTHVALLHSTILFKVMFWYRVAVTVRDHSEPVRLRPMKVQLGNFDLDDEDQANLQRTVIQRELRKVEKVIEAFEGCSGGEDDCEGGNGLQWHGATVRKMREELRTIIQEARGQSDRL